MGNFLRFTSKLEMFSFLVSADAAGLEHLQFLRELVREDRELPLRYPSNMLAHDAFYRLIKC